ncbi:peptidase U32 [Gordoniibacillus kamchatkensis]|uniref:Peptidase U32 n=1 Tax=Gordoniibacillus kamchatkensis TaxID=1590651 RepID=A0ABR5AJ40_9BACL|nr:peptidase U32 family protein [Paenibacillus sp. VKM B-2647]KIL41068.1 peptidase U32 [Paenibacillus sp. VKM B-2647]
MNKPELLIPAGSAEQMAAYAEAGADALLVGDKRYGLRLPGDVPAEALRRAVPEAHKAGVKVYAALNHIMDNDTVRTLPDYVKELAAAGVDAVVYGDPAVLAAVKAHAPQLALHWNAEMTSTNWATASFWGRKGATRVVAARELNLEELAEMASRLKGVMEVEVQVHGMTNIYHSKRKLLHNYTEHLGRPSEGQSYNPERGLYLVEQERPTERFPIYEDESGTHVMSSDDICMLENLPELMDAGIASFKIESVLKSAEYNIAALRSYRACIDAYCTDPAGFTFDQTWLETIQALQPSDRELSYGFFYKEQVY